MVRPTLEVADIPTGILLSGWSDEEPDWSNPRNGEYASLGTDAAAIIFWVEVFCVQTGDWQTFEMFDPQGNRLLINKTTIPNNNSVWLGYAGKPRPLQGWAAGAYRTEYLLERNGIPVVTTVRHLEIR